MVIICPHCRTKVWTAPDGTCPACRKDVVSQAVSGAGEFAEQAEPASAAPHAAVPASAPPASPEIECRGRRRGLLSVLSIGVVCGFLALEAVTGAANVLSYALLAFLVLTLLIQLRLFVSPPRLAIRDGWLVVRGTNAFRVPVTDVADLRLVTRRVHVLLKDCGAVTPPERQELLAGSAARYGGHYALPTGSFTRDQLDRLRQGLGLPTADGAAVDPTDAFATVLRRLTPHVLVTPALVAINLAIFAGLLVASRQAPGPLEWTMIDWGANLAPRSTQGEWWRLVMFVFLHFNLLHLAFNMWILWDVGRLVERLLGNAVFLVVYLTCGFFGSVASVLWNENVVSAGASGAIFGLCGVVLGFMLPRRDSIPIEVIKEHRGSMTTFLVVNLWLGFSVPWIDMAAHVGGLLAGLISGLLATQALSPERCAARRTRSVLVCGGALIVCVATVYFLPQRSSVVQGHFLRATSLDVWAASEIQKAESQRHRGVLTAAAAANAIERRVVAAYAQLERELTTGREPAAVGGEWDRLTEYVRLRHAGMQLLAQAASQSDTAGYGFALEKFDEARGLFPEGTKKPAGAVEPPPTLFSEVARVAATESRVLQRYRESLGRVKSRQLSEAGLAEVIAQEVLPPWRASHRRFRAAGPRWTSENRQEIDRILEYLRLREESWELLVEGLRTGDQQKVKEGERKAQAAAALHEQAR